MRVLLLSLALVSTYSFAGIPEELTPNQLEKAGVEVISWYDVSPEDIEEFKDHVLCTPVTVIFPLVGTEKPEYTKANARSVLRVNGKILTHPNVILSKTLDEERNTATVCLPLGAEYEADIIFSYNPKDSDLVPMCTPSFELKDIERFLKN